jgi:hypothetical protein
MEYMGVVAVYPLVCGDLGAGREGASVVRV